MPTPPYGYLYGDLTFSTVLPSGYASGYAMSYIAAAALYSGWAPLMSPMFSGTVTVDGSATINQFLDVSGSISASGSLAVSGSITTSGSVTASGATVSGQLATLEQVQAQATNYAVDAGTVNALAVTLTPTPVLMAGLTIRVLAAYTNTLATTLSVNGGVSHAIQNPNGMPLVPQQIAAMGIYTFTFNGTAWVLQSISAAPGVPTGIENREAEFLSSGSWTAPPGVTQIMLDGSAGGGGGAYGYPGQTGGGGGGGGAAVIGELITVVPGTTYTITIGGPGMYGSSSSVNGAQGGTTSFGMLLTLVGGYGGLANGAYGAGGGQGGIQGIYGNYTNAMSFGGAGGGSIFGTGAPGGSGNINGQTPGGYGAGGGGGAEQQGGYGAYGFMRFSW